MKKRLITSVTAILSITLAMVASIGAPTASATTSCDGDSCVVVPDTLQTPLGPATITVSATDVVTVQFTPTTANTLVLGVLFSFPPGPPTFVRTSVGTSGGLINVDTFQIPQVPPARFALPNLVIVSRSILQVPAASASVELRWYSRRSSRILEHVDLVYARQMAL